MCVSIGCGSACDSTSRQMSGPSSSTARYDLYSNSARTTLWGSWQTGYDTAGVQMSVSHNSSATQTVYARFLASQQTDLAGSYTATLTAQPFITYVNQSGAPACPTGTLTASGSASVTATVSSNCTIGSTAVSFGSQGVLSSNKDAPGHAQHPMHLEPALRGEPERGNFGRHESDPAQDDVQRRQRDLWPLPGCRAVPAVGLAPPA